VGVAIDIFSTRSALCLVEQVVDGTPESWRGNKEMVGVFGSEGGEEKRERSGYLVEEVEGQYGGSRGSGE
jgi:hypothetical protein